MSRCRYKFKFTKGISQVVLAWNTPEEMEGKQISGNTLLEMYGEWLFDGALLSSVG